MKHYEKCTLGIQQGVYVIDAGLPLVMLYNATFDDTMTLQSIEHFTQVNGAWGVLGSAKLRQLTKLLINLLDKEHEYHGNQTNKRTSRN